MTKFNRPKTRSAVSSPVKAEAAATGKTHEGVPGFARDAKSELFLAAVSSFAGEDKFYEGKIEGDERFCQLAQQVALEDPAWLVRFVSWLRDEGAMRSNAIVAAAEGVRARLASGADGDAPGEAGFSRQLVRAAIRRADEPGEFIAYWMSRYGRNVPKPVKRGVGDKVIELGTEFNYLKWGTSEARGLTFADILNLTHAGDRKGSSQRFKGAWQGGPADSLFGYAVKRRYQPDLAVPESLPTLTRREALMALPVDERRAMLESPEVLKQAGMTWEALAGWLQGPMDTQAWEAVIPSMGYMALLRNLRNFDQAGVSDELAQMVAARLSDPAQVAKSRQFPMRFLSAYRHAPSLRWGYALEKALDASIDNIPVLGGRTLILVDTSESMHSPFSKDGRVRPGLLGGAVAYGRDSEPGGSKLMRWDAAAIFGIALAIRSFPSADVVSFSDSTKKFPIVAGESLLKALDRWKTGGYFIGYGTYTEEAVRQHYAKHDRVVVLTDEQAGGYWGRSADVFTAVPASVPCYTWNLAGYQHGHAPSGSGTRHTFGGLTDASFKMIDLIERGRNADWPF